MKLFGRICRMNDRRLMKTAMLWMVHGDRRRERPARRWLDDIADWRGYTAPERQSV